MSVEWFLSQSHPEREVQLACCDCHPRRRVGAVCSDEELAHPWHPIQIVTVALQNKWMVHASTIVTPSRAESIKVRSNQSLAAAASLSVLKPTKANRRDVPSGLWAILMSVIVPGGAPLCSKCFRRRSWVRLGGRFFTMRRDMDVGCKVQVEKHSHQLRSEHAAPRRLRTSPIIWPNCTSSCAMASAASIFGQEKNPRGIPKAPFIVSGCRFRGDIDTISRLSRPMSRNTSAVLTATSRAPSRPSKTRSRTFPCWILARHSWTDKSTGNIATWTQI